MGSDDVGRAVSLLDLASRDDYGRVLAAVSRLDALLATAREELEREERLWPRSVNREGRPARGLVG